jgi:uncharacterized membrane protein YGL010W
MSPSPQPPPAAAPDRLRRRPLRRILQNWRQRHRHPFNFWIHLAGIPMAVAGAVLLSFGEWVWGAGLFVGGYLLQFVGHLVEGNDLGEWAAVKKLLGLPYVGISPRFAPPGQDR